MPIPVLPGRGKARPGVSGDQIASDALRYRGAGYVFGGPARAPGDWDCSSFVFWVLSKDLGMTVAGCRFGAGACPPNSHGPDVLAIAHWAQPVGTPARGDLACWMGAGAGGHIGIVLGPDQMVSALNPAQGTTVTPIRGTGPGAPLVFRRVPGSAAGPAAGGGTPGPPGAGATPSGASLAGPAFALLVVGGMVTVILAGAVVAGAAVVLAGSWIAGMVMGDG